MRANFSSAAGFSVEAVGGDVDGFDGLGRLDVTDVMRQPDVDGDRAVELRRVELLHHRQRRFSVAAE